MQTKSHFNQSGIVCLDYEYFFFSSLSLSTSVVSRLFQHLCEIRWMIYWGQRDSHYIFFDNRNEIQIWHTKTKNKKKYLFFILQIWICQLTEYVYALVQNFWKVLFIHKIKSLIFCLFDIKVIKRLLLIVSNIMNGKTT